MLVTLAYEWFVIRTALGTTAGIATAFVVIDILVGLLLNHLVDAIVQGGTSPAVDGRVGRRDHARLPEGPAGGVRIARWDDSLALPILDR